MSCDVNLTIKYDRPIEEHLRKIKSGITKSSFEEDVEYLEFSTDQFYLHNERFKGQRIHNYEEYKKGKPTGKIISGHGFTVFIRKNKDEISFYAPCHWNLEHAKETIRDWTKWIQKNLPNAKILYATSSSTAGYAIYKYRKGKWLLTGCGDYYEEKDAKMD